MGGMKMKMDGMRVLEFIVGLVLYVVLVGCWVIDVIGWMGYTKRVGVCGYGGCHVRIDGLWRTTE